MVTHQLQVRCRPVKVRRSETDNLPLSYTQCIRSRLVEAPSFTNSVKEGLKIHKIGHEYSCLLTDKQMPLKHNLLNYVHIFIVSEI